MNLKLRDSFQLAIYKIINPLVRMLIRLGFTPNLVTTVGLILNIGVAVIFVFGAEKSNRGDMSYIGWGGALVLFAGLFDMLDGQVARLGNMSSRFGALYDSVLDRYSEMIMFLGICYYLVAHHFFLSSLFAFIALIGSMMVSYTRARAEALGVECKGGMMQRPERVVTIGVSAIACGILAQFLPTDYKIYFPGINVHIFETISVFTLPISVMALLTNLTAVKRLRDAKLSLEAADSKKVKDSVIPVRLIGFLLLLGTGLTSIDAHAQKDDPSPINFPTPANIVGQLFYLQRDPNTNTIVYQINTGEDGEVVKKEPISMYWMRYAEDGARKALSYVQRKFAYGISSKYLGNGQFSIRFNARKKIPLYLIRSDKDNRYHVYLMLNNRKIQLERIFLRIDGGSMFFPNVKYVEITGYDALNPKKKITERIKI